MNNMLIELVLISITSIMLFLIFGVRYFNLAYAKENNSKLLSFTDKKLNHIGHKAYVFFRNTNRDIVDLLKDTPHIILNLLNKIFFKLYKRTKKLIDLIKGNKIKKDGGSVSLFLQKIEKE
jgi:hypothetical protein